jgi:DNA invertase Pin-like site-specific DNA recombinase
MMENKLYVAYYRVSKLSVSGKERKERGESSLGMEAQKYIVRNFYGRSVIKEFEEVASAKDIEHRQVLQSAIEFCIKNKYTLVTAKLDRLSRNTEDALKIYEKLKKNLVCCDIPNLDKFTLTLFVAFSERERQIIQLRIKSALAVRIKEKGHWYSKEVMMSHESCRPFLSGETGTLAAKANSAKAKLNPNNIRGAQMITAWRSEGKSWNEIINLLNKNQFMTSRGLHFSQTNQAIRLYNSQQNIVKERIFKDTN